MTKKGRKSIATERRAQILDAFHQCAVRNGLEKASLREVAGAAGLPVSILHHYFKNREEMVSELVNRIVSGIIENLLAEIDDIEDPRLRFDKIFRLLFSPKTQQLEDGSLFYDFWSFAHRSEVVRRTFQKQIRQQREAFVRIFTEAGQLSGLSESDMNEIANIMIALVEGMYYVLDMDSGNVSLEKISMLTRRFIELYADEKRRTKSAGQSWRKDRD